MEDRSADRDRRSKLRLSAIRFNFNRRVDRFGDSGFQLMDLVTNEWLRLADAFVEIQRRGGRQRFRRLHEAFGRRSKRGGRRSCCDSLMATAVAVVAISIPVPMSQLTPVVAQRHRCPAQGWF